MKIVLDVMGGDYSPEQTVLGAVKALNEDSDLYISAFGDEEAIKKVLNKAEFSSSRLEVFDAKDVITNEESPTMAIKLKKESSLVKSLEYLMANDDADALVSSGSTGAVLTGAFMKIGRIKGISRPALAPVLPTVTGGSVILCDCGANVDCKAVNILHFAYMGAAYATCQTGVKNPRIGLLSNGAEDKKGNELTKEAFDLLKESPLNFVGNCEARDILSGNFDVVVCDGFNGNIALKSAEGTANAVFTLLKQGIKEGGLSAKLGAALLLKTFKNLKKKLDYNENGGACFLGVNKVVVKSHGASKAKSVCSSILQAKALAESGVVDKINAFVKGFKSEDNKSE